MSSIFYININNHETVSRNHNSTQKLQNRNNLRLNKLLIQPQKIVIIYQQQKTYVQKILVQSTFTQSVTFKIIQPQKSILNVKYKKSQLNSKQTNELFLFFNCQKQKSIVEDQFIIVLEKQRFQLHVPITCRPKFRTSHRKLSLSKSMKTIQTSDLKNKDGFQRAKTKALTLRRRPITAKRQQFQSQMQIMINNFLERFSQIQEFVKEKNVKKQIFIGEKALSRQKHNKITKFNDEINDYIVQKIRKKVEQRNKVQFSQQGPVVRNFQGIILRWSKDKNIPRIVYDKGLAKVQQKIRQYLIDLRFQKIHRIFSLYREFQSSQEHCNLPLHKRHEIYVQKLQKRLNRKQEISLELNFDWSSVISTRLQCQRETFRKVEFGINPRIGFDNWVAIEEGARYSHEVMRYEKKQPIPQWMCHPRIDKKDKLIVQYENGVRVSHSSDGIVQSNENEKVAVSVNKFMREDEMSDEIESILDLIRVDKRDVESNKMKRGESSNANLNTISLGGGSRLQIKANSDQNTNMKPSITKNNPNNSNNNKKSSSHVLSIRQIPSFESRQQQRDEHQLSLVNQSQKLVSFFFNNSNKSLTVYYPFVSQCQLVRSLSEQLLVSQKQQKQIERFVLMEMSRSRYHLDYVNMISYSREEQPQLQSHVVLNKLRQKYHPKHKQYHYHPVQLIESLISPHHNRLLHKLSKQDKHQFDRLTSKAKRILSMIDYYEKKNFIDYNYKLKGDIDLEISGKYRLRNYEYSNKRLQKEMENLRVLKNDSLGKAYLLQIYSYQTAKNKPLSIFLP